MGTVIVLFILGMGILFAVKGMMQDKKNGKSFSCGGDCSRCSGCHRSDFSS